MNQVEMKKSKLFYAVMAAAAFLIILLPVGIANIVFGYIFHDNPCILCWGQREAMIFIGVMALFIVRYGIKPYYVASLLLMSAFGMYQSFAHIGPHAHRDLGQGFGPMIAGVHTYGWAEFVFWFVIIALAILLYIAPKFAALEQEGKEGEQSVRKLSKPIRGVFIVSAFIIASNVFQALTNTGIPPFMGQSDPVRFSLNPKEIIWSTENWSGLWSNLSLLGKRDVESPDFAFAQDKLMHFNHDSANSPFEKINSALNITSEQDIVVNAPLNTLAFERGIYIASSKYDVYFMNQNFKVEDHFKIDPYYSATIDPIIGVLPYKEDKWILMGSNKSFLRFMQNPNADKYLEYADFLEGAEHFQAHGADLGRGRIDTVRAKFHYVMGSASDSNYLYLASVPNKNDAKKLIISAISLGDLVLSSEFTPKATLKPERSLGELYITSMVLKDGKLYALSKNYNVIAKIDIATQTISEVISYPAQISNARALLLNPKGGFSILSYQDGQNKLFTLH